MTARKAAHSLERAKGAFASGFATDGLHHAMGMKRCWAEESEPQHRLINLLLLSRTGLCGYCARAPTDYGTSIGETGCACDTEEEPHMRLHQPTVRLALLLRGLNRSSFEELPWQVGRKTLDTAADAGFVEVEPGSAQRPRPRCRLTELGALYRAENRYVFD